ncbi:ATP-binding protein [Sphingomonas parva]|uniref:ATP-binding protein n=1 Tax=Sphingomonas parva TaxID=2555898 RepID=A0A4Y8ZQW0_9SPHN|nr:ATP-binding protein [Sphingomonas parva]TFI57515.1 ATP-binding protein [Sphingomonas parva]
MNKLATILADRVRLQVGATARSGPARELRLVFLGPPHELMAEVFNELARTPDGGQPAHMPVLLQVPKDHVPGNNPSLGQSGWCDEDHLLRLRNTPGHASYVALLPPGEHKILSVDTTTGKFGVAERNNGGNATFDAWWDDSFVQELVVRAISEAGVPDLQADEARQLIEAGARAADEVESGTAPREGAWRLLSRLFSITQSTALKPGDAISLACGVPPMRSGGISAKEQLGTLRSIAEAMTEGFRRSVERLAEGATAEDQAHLAGFLQQVRETCEVATTFERATPAYYRPASQLEMPAVPGWWAALDVEKWTELLAEEPSSAGDIGMACTNALADLGKGMPAVVASEVELQFNTKGGDSSHATIEVNRTPAAGNGLVGTVAADRGDTLVDASPPSHKLPLTYKATADNFKPGSMKVISLANWQPGVVVVCRLARKFSPPRRPSRRGNKAAAEWESGLTLPGAGRYELLVFVSPGTSLDATGQVTVDQPDGNAGVPVSIALRQATPEMYRAEIEAEGNCQLDVAFSRVDKSGSSVREASRTFITCEDVPEVGCRSEFERLIKANRRKLESFDAKAAIPVNRAVRSTMLQDWILASDAVRTSYQPIVLAEDYGDHWSPPSWGTGNGPVLSRGSFIQDPRPAPHEFNPPAEFLDAREEIARRIRGDGDQSGVFETARLGEWALRDEHFAALIEQYVGAYHAWLSTDPEIASWSDVLAITSLDGSGRSLAREPVAIMLSPMHPLRVGWHVVAQRILSEADEAGKPCPAASVLDPDCVPDIISLHLQSPAGVDQVDFLSVENGSDYWSVLWNGRALEQLPERSLAEPFGDSFGISVGGISVGFSAAQVRRALDDVSDLLAAKPVVAVAVSSAGGATDACNQGLVDWCTARFQVDARRPRSLAMGPRFVEIFDERPSGVRPDDATISNLSEDTADSVRWYLEQPDGAVPDLGIIAQLDMSEPRSERVEGRTPLGMGGMIRHRVRRQLPRSFLAESRQSVAPDPTGDVLPDKVASLLSAVENMGAVRSGLQFAPNVHEVQHMLRERQTDFVAVSSAAIDPACFLGGWLEGAYLWDFDLPSYSHRAGDTNGYYLLSQVTDADRDALSQALGRLPGCGSLDSSKVEDVLLEVARRGIPTIKGLAGDDAGATGDLGIFVGVRILQDRFRGKQHEGDGLLHVIGGTAEDPTIAIVVPVDPFRGYIADLSKALGRDGGDLSQLRPDLLVVGIDLSGGTVRIKVTPVEVKCRPTSRFGKGEALAALDQAKALSSLLVAMQPAGQPRLWTLAYQHLLLSVIGFGLRVYSQHPDVVGHAARWSEFHERIATAILSGKECVEVDTRGRLMILDDTPASKPQDFDGDGFEESMVVGREDAGKVVAGDAAAFYEMVRLRLRDWQLLPGAATPVPFEQQPTLAAEADPMPTALVVTKDAEEPAVAREETVPVSGDEEDSPPPREPVEQREGFARAAAVEVAGKGVILNVGHTIDGFQPRDLALNISDTRLNQLNIGVVGDLGTGKTQLLKSLIAQIASSGPENRGHRPRFLIFDYKRDYSSDDFVAATGARVIRPHRIPLNLFDTRTSGDVPAPWFDRFRFFADVLGKIYSGIGTVQREKLKQAVRQAYRSAAPGVSPTLREVHEAYHEIVEGKPDSPMSIIGDMLDMEIFEEDQSRIVPFDNFLDGVVVIALDALGQDDHSKNVLVAVMLNMFYENMLRTPKRPFIGQDPQLRAIDSYLLVDEADNIMRYEFDVLRKLLLQGREFGTGVILASQYLRHFKAGGTDYREPLLTWFVHKVPNVTPTELSALGLSASAAEMAERIKGLGNHQCLYKSFDVGGEVIRGYPFFELMRTREVAER